MSDSDGGSPDPTTRTTSRSVKRKAVRLPERIERLEQKRRRLEQQADAQQRLKELNKELKDRLPPKRERFTPVERLRRRAAPSDKPLQFGRHAVGGDPTTTFRMVCWNIEDGLDIDGAVEALADHPNLVGAGAVCLQEMDPTGVEEMASRLALNYVYLESSKDERTERGFGNAILSPYPITEAQAIPLPHVAKAYGRPRAAVSATIEWPTDPVDEHRDQGADGNPVIPVSVWSVHAEIPSLPLSKRVAQYTAVAARAIAPNPEHLLVGGDFNTTTLTSVVALDELYELFGLDRLSYPAGPSLRRAGKLFYLDHIYGRGFRVDAVGVEREVIASDHWPLWVDVGR